MSGNILVSKAMHEKDIESTQTNGLEHHLFKSPFGPASFLFTKDLPLHSVTRPAGSSVYISFHLLPKQT